MFRKNMKKGAVIGTILLAVALAFGGCGKRGDIMGIRGNAKTTNTYEAAPAAGDVYEGYEYDDYEMDYATEEANLSEYDPGGGNGVYDTSNGTLIEPGATEKRKLIRTVDLDVETKEFDKVMTDVEAKIAELGGYIEQQYSYNGSSYGYQNSKVRTATMVVRIPDSKLDEFVTTMNGISNVVSKRTTAQDVTLQYTDIQAKKDMYLAEQESLMALLERAESVEDITYLTQRLTEVRYSIESMERQLRVYDNQVDYATINLDITEVEILTPQVVEKKTDKEEVEEGYASSWASIGNWFKNFGKNFVINLPYLILIAGIVLVNAVVVLIILANVRKKIRKARALNAKKAADAKAAATANAADAKDAPAADAQQAVESSAVDAENPQADETKAE